jgi:hypothetical protein
MAQNELSGIPTFSGDVVKMKLNPGVTPTFNEEFQVKVFKVEPSQIPSLKDENVKITKVQPKKPTFDEKADIRINSIIT